jgi:alanyl-tRNA synthetase
MKTLQVKQSFLDFFERNGHKVVGSGPLILDGSFGLLFTNAGMVQFKDVFLGKLELPYNRVTSSQFCFRAGGKHNDLENIGFTKRHHTFFEMLGNFSFNDYYKEEAIKFSWEYITEVLSIPKDKLYITVFKGDTESVTLWRKYANINSNKLITKGLNDNFWSMGDVGPCGYCSEIFYDCGPSAPAADRFIEIWNLVFLEYNRLFDGTLVNLNKRFIDTGMGLERITSVVQHVYDNYCIDIFDALITELCNTLRCERTNNSVRVVADHLRACIFLLHFKLKPSYTGSGYVLRRVIRRTIYHMLKLNSFCFLYELIHRAVLILSGIYPYILESIEMIKELIKEEEFKFKSTLASGLFIFNRYLNKSYTDVLSGQLLFKLYNTYGLPISFIYDVACDRNLGIDVSGFRSELLIHKKKSKLNYLRV